MKKVIIVIPLHTNKLNDFEWKSLRQCIDMFSIYEICCVKPESLNVSNILKVFPEIAPISFPDEFFININAYNRLMLSADFYRKFLDYKYVLICQTDVWVFKNELQQWLDMDYDYIGAPWIKKESHRKWYYKIYCIFVVKVLQIPIKSDKIGGRSGNGGFSLRKTEKHYKVCQEKGKLIEKYINMSVKTSLYHEDVFWSTENPEFLYPDYNTSLNFAWDQFPEKAFEATKGVLPFACHGWFKTKSQFYFWKGIIK